MKDFLAKIYHNLLYINNSYSHTHLDDEPKRLLLKVCLYISFLMLFFFSILHAFIYQDVSDKLFILELFTCLITLYAIYSLKRNPTPNNTNKIALISTLVFAFFLLFFASLNQNQSYGLVWTFFFPIFAIIINGPKSGLRYTLVFLTVLLIMAYNGIGHWQAGIWDEMSFIRLTASLLILTFIVYINEVSLVNAKARAQMALEEQQTLSTIDELTKIFNRRHINKALYDAIQYAERHNSNLVITLFDIDDFKQINDQYGHLIGDKVLSEMTQEIKKIIRTTDVFGRWGGEEFLILLPQESIESASQVCEKIREYIQEITFSECSIQITCSFGIAQFKHGMTPEVLIDQADQALYIAKKSGKNQVAIFA